MCGNAGCFLDSVQVVTRGIESNKADCDAAGTSHVFHLNTHAKAPLTKLSERGSFFVSSASRKSPPAARVKAGQEDHVSSIGPGVLRELSLRVSVICRPFIPGSGCLRGIETRSDSTVR